MSSTVSSYRSLLFAVALTAPAAVPTVAAGAPAPVEYLFREWHTTGIQNGTEPLERTFAGISFYPTRELGIFYTQTFDPREKRPVYRHYGDRFFSFRSIARWGWDFQNFLRITLRRDRGNIVLRDRFLLREILVMEPEGRRTVADFVFQLDGPSEWLVFRCIHYADRPTWLWGEVFLNSERYRLVSVGLASFGGFAGRGYPNRRRWIAGLETGFDIEKTNFPLPLADWPVLFLHHKNALGDRGSIAVIEPDALDSMKTLYRGMGVLLTPKRNVKRVRFGLSDTRKPDDIAIAEMRRNWPELRRFFRNVRWDLNPAPGRAWVRRRLSLLGGEAVLDTPAGAVFRDALPILRRAPAVGDRVAERRFGRALTDVIEHDEEAFEAALSGL
ncbi:MAG: hypothetical protein GXP31_07765 [Kiritimatiellaeota bacterium]|nr:hypothetical protein [Kiritimatiellota bacterium]